MRGLRRGAAVLAALTLAAASCGYHLVGRGGQFPEGVTKVAVPIFGNNTTKVEIARILTEDFINSLLASGKVEVVPHVEAQAVIKGTVTRYELEPITFDRDHRAIEQRLIVAIDASLIPAGSTTPTFSERGIWAQHDFPVSDDLARSTREEETAMEEVSGELSSKIISLLTEGF